MDKETIALLISKAKEARSKSYSPYSRFSVGAALLSRDGKVYTGANIENASYTPTVCAERVAFFTALHDGKSDFTAIAIAGGEQAKEGKLCPPCGVCLQVMSEFCKGDFTIILCDGEGSKILTLDELLPHRFALEK